MTGVAAPVGMQIFASHTNRMLYAPINPDYLAI